MGVLLDCARVAKEQFAHRETEELLAMIDGVAAKVGSRGQVFDDFLTVMVCTLAGGTMEEEYLATVQKYVVGEKGKRPIDQLAAAFGKLIEIMEETRADILGDLFQGGITYGEHAQYFTPAPICDLMAQVTAGDEPGLGYDNQRSVLWQRPHAPRGGQTETVRAFCWAGRRSAVRENNGDQPRSA